MVGLLVFQACGGGGTGAGEPSEPESAPELEGLLATTDLSVGSNRIAFLLQTPEKLITLPQVTVSSTYFPGGGSDSIAGETVVASFHLWPFGTRGNYVTEMSFDRAGRWELEARVQESENVLLSTRIPITVKDASFTPVVGSVPPMVRNKTIDDVETLAQMTAGPRPDPELYQLTIEEAVASGQPLVLVMSSPGFCTSPTCGPQVDTVHDLKEIYRGQANFIHVEVYDNPEDIQEDLSQGRYSPVVEAWGLTQKEGYLNESWVFILDKSGRIAYKYEGYASLGELEQGLLAVL